MHKWIINLILIKSFTYAEDNDQGLIHLPILHESQVQQRKRRELKNRNDDIIADSQSNRFDAELNEEELEDILRNKYTALVYQGIGTHYVVSTYTHYVL